tara:strand:+ start:1323 stop:2744 length:1422 start_codon:yes stop_codon:yes gene_type:complete
MLGKLRNFSKSKFAGVLITIIIIPFVFWGMGNVFSGGNKNSVVKINNQNISTNDFISYVNESSLDPKLIKDNLDKNILEEILSQLISINILDFEVNDIGIILSDKVLLSKIKNDKKFIDENKKFSRIKYEKFLLENNTSSINYEKRVRDGKMQADLFQYISGGIKTPEFIVKNFYLEDTKEIEIEFLNLEKLYKKEFSNLDREVYINDNKENIYRDYIDISYIKITPIDLINNVEYDNEFFQILDDIDNDIANGSDITNIANKHNLKITNKKNYYLKENDEEFLKKIYEDRSSEKIKLFDNEEYYLLYEINNINKMIPSLNDEQFLKEIDKKLSSKSKFNFNKELLKKIETNKFTELDYKKLENDTNKIQNLIIKSADDNSFFNIDSLKMLYTIPKNEFLLIVDNNKKVYLTRVLDFRYQVFDKSNVDYNKYLLETNYKLKNNISISYDNLLNKKYEVVVNENTLERLKNFFK